MSDLTTNLSTQISNTGNSTSAAVQATSDGADKLITSDFETFLKMLTAQLENQDPLNPLQSTDFAVQLATFSGVEQQVLTNDRLTELTGQLTASSLSSLSNWIGSEVLTELDVSFDGTPVDLVLSPQGGAETTKLTIRNTSDVIVDEFEIGTDLKDFQWPGQVGGTILPDGTYRITTVNYDANGNEMSEIGVSAFQRVVEVLPNGGSPVLGLHGGATVSTENVTSVRQPR